MCFQDNSSSVIATQGAGLTSEVQRIADCISDLRVETPRDAPA